MSTIIKVVIIGAMLVAIAYGGLCVYSNCKGPDTGVPDLPSQEKATHSFYIENTGGLLLSSDYEQHGQMVGSRLFILHGFWELRGKEFKYIDNDIPLDERIFGEITVKRRASK